MAAGHLQCRHSHLSGALTWRRRPGTHLPACCAPKVCVCQRGECCRGEPCRRDAALKGVAAQVQLHQRPQGGQLGRQRARQAQVGQCQLCYGTVAAGDAFPGRRSAAAAAWLAARCPCRAAERRNRGIPVGGRVSQRQQRRCCSVAGCRRQFAASQQLRQARAKP